VERSEQGEALVRVDGRVFAIADIRLRMLTARELYRAQGFPEGYIIDRTADGKPLPKDAQVRMCGNSVCPPIAKALVEANVGEVLATERRNAA
jgi:DNA (cytosine-5)-methyltransferase 1